MLLREAVRAAATAKLSDSRRVPIVASFEPLHLTTYVQAHLAHRFPAESPRVVTFGYDALERGLDETSGALARATTLLCLDWQDLHPDLTWRSRRAFGFLTVDEITERATRLRDRLLRWLEMRRGAETYVAPPAVAWLPYHDPAGPTVIGLTASAAGYRVAEILDALVGAGARALTMPDGFDLRNLLQYGCPLTLAGCEALAARFVECAYPACARTKAIITDLDGTLWAGVIGEDGVRGIQCGPDGRGYPYWVFQKFLARLRGEGILLSFVSKNNAADVLPVFDSLQLPLSLKDFATFRCDWEPKSQNVLSVIRELNIAPDAAIVIDDSTAELAEIRAHVPDVVIMQTPRDGDGWSRLMYDLQSACAGWAVTDSDRVRTASFHAERARRAHLGTPAAAADTLEHLRDLALEIGVDRQAFADPRSLELINKTNQFNLTGERIGGDDWMVWASASGTFCTSARLRDRFGDFGTIAVVTGKREGAEIVIRQLVLSCRAFGRGVETVLLADVAADPVVQHVRGTFRATGKNEPAESFLRGLGCDIGADGAWSLTRDAVLVAARRVAQEAEVRVTVSAPAVGSGSR